MDGVVPANLIVTRRRTDEALLRRANEEKG